MSDQTIQIVVHSEPVNIIEVSGNSDDLISIAFWQRDQGSTYAPALTLRQAEELVAAIVETSKAILARAKAAEK